MSNSSAHISSKGQISLLFAARPQAVCKHLFELLGLMGLLVLVPMSVSLASGQYPVTLAYLAIAIICAICYALSRKIKRVKQLQRNETLAVAALVFITSSLLFTLPMLQYNMSFIDAWFETVSGVTTTGLSTLSSVEDKPIAFLFARGWMQWVGGLGVIVLALAIHTQPGIETKMFGADAADVDSHIGGTRGHAKRILVVYAVLTFIGIGALLFAGSSLIDAIVHAMAAVSTGGFANRDDSFASYGISEQWIVSIISILGAISLHLYYRPTISSLRASFRDPQLRCLLLLVAFVPLAVFALVKLSGGEASIGQAYFNTISAITTAGFASSDILPFGSAAMLLICACMFVGGGIGSTAGGIKIYRLLVLFKAMQMFLRRASSGVHSQLHLRLDGKRVDYLTIENILAVICGYLVFLVGSWLIFLGYGMPPIESLYEVTSALGTAGVSSGLTSAELPTPLKLVLIFNMLLGRVETVAIIVLLLPATWIGKRRS